MHKIILSILSLSLLATFALAQAPNITNVSFDEYTNVVTITFDNLIYTTPDLFAIGGLTFDDDNGGPNPDVTLNGGTILNTNVSDTYIEIKLLFSGNIGSYTKENDPNTYYTWGTDYSRLKSLESFANTDNITLTIRENTFMGVNNETNPEMGPFAVNYIPSNNVPQLIYANYDAAINLLTLAFDRKVQWDAIDEDLMFWWVDTNGVEHHDPGNGILNSGEDRNANGVLDFEPNVVFDNITVSDGLGSVTLLGGSVQETIDSDTLTIALLFDDYKNLENLNTSALTITFPSYTFLDTLYNTVAPVTDYNLIFTPDADPLTADSANYDKGKNELQVYFTNNLSTGYIQVPKFSFVIAGVVTPISAPATAPTINASQRFAKIKLLPSDQMIIEGLMNANPDSTVNLNIDSYAILDNLGNGNLACTGVPVRIIQEGSSYTPPEVDSVSYDAGNNILSVTFNNKILSTEDYVNIQGFSLLSGEDTIFVTTSEYSVNNKILNIYFNSTDEYNVEILTLNEKNALLLLVEPFSVYRFPVSNANGNWAVTADSNIVVSYNSDDYPPVPKLVKYNASTHKLELDFNEAMRNTADFSKFSFAGLALTGGAVEYGQDYCWLILNLTDNDISSIESLSDSLKVNVSISINADAFINADSLSNIDILDFADKSVLSDGNETVTVLVGYGRDFWLMSKESFPTDDRLIPASIRKIGQHCTIYVADDQWQPYLNVDMFGTIIETNNNCNPVTPAKVDLLFDHFEITGEAYYQINDIFAYGREIVVPQMVNIFLCDIRDEYNLGRNDASSSYWVGSFFNPNDQKTAWEAQGEFNTNECDLIYIDSWPQLFSDSDSSWYWYVSGSTQQWRLNLPPGKTNPQYTISNIEVSALNSLDNAYTKLLCYKVDPWESQWMIEGFASLSEFFVEGKASFCGAGDPTTPTADALMNFTNGLKTRIDFHNSYLFLLYLYEKFGGLDFIKKLAVQPAVGMTAIEETFAKMLIDYPNEDPFVRNLWQTYSAEDVFSSYGMACLLDTTNMAYTDSTNTALYDPAITPDNRMFQFDNANLYGVISNKNATILKWDAVKGAPPYDISQEGWSFNYYYSTFNVLAGLTNPMIASTFYLDSSAAMVDTMMINILYPFSSLNFYQVALRNEAVVTFNNPDFYFKYFPADMVNKQISFPLSPDTNWTFYHFGEVVDSTTGDTVINQIGDYKTMVLVGILGGTGKITQETIPPTLTQLSVAQSPIVANRFDIYLIVSDLVWGDGSTAGDVPQIRYTYEGVTTTLLMTPYNFLTGFGYQGDYSFYTSYLNFENPGTYTIEAYFTDLAGEEYIIGPVNFIVSSFNPGSGTSFDIEGATISLAPSAFSSPLKISAKTVLVNALPGANGEFLYNTAYFNAPPVETREPLGPAYHIQPEVMLNEPANISLPYANFIGSHSPSELGVYLYRDGEWIYLGGTPDPSTQTINVRAKQLGLFQIQAGPHGTTPLDLLIPDRYALKQNYPNPFNPTTKIEYQIAHADKVTLKVYDILGREVANLIDGFQNTGFYSAYWNGCSESGVPVASGVYLYRLKSGKFDKTCKMLLLK